MEPDSGEEMSVLKSQEAQEMFSIAMEWIVLIDVWFCSFTGLYFSGLVDCVKHVFRVQSLVKRGEVKRLDCVNDVNYNFVCVTVYVK